jgi:hypothetical protein
MSDSDASHGPIATEVLYEDDQVRIWDQRLAPGDATAPHRHENDYALVDIEGELLHIEPLPGHDGKLYDEPLDLPIKRGQVYFIPAGSVERATNRGTRSYRGILVEFKR